MTPTQTSLALRELLRGTTEPATITFRDAPPPGMRRIEESGPSGCSYWRLAARGQSFYTTGADHLRCPIGAYTHGAELTGDAEARLGEMLDRMVGLRYLRAEEVAGIPRRTAPLRVAVYTPLSGAPATPDVVLFQVDPRQAMLLTEAASACGALAPSQGMGRPACAVIAATLASGQVTTSWGCIGSRVYTELPDDQLYAGVPGALLDRLVDALRSLVAANAELERYHRAQAVA
jgi:uncharacterized protein (DUF169 family)